MRKHLIWVLGLVVALAGAGIAVSIASAVPNTQTITGKITPSKLPKSTRAPITLFTDVASTNSGNPNNIPNPTTLALVDTDKDGAYQQKGLPTCDPTKFTSQTTTAQARGLCSNALIGAGSSQIAVPTGASTPPININATVTAFNGKGKTIVFHTYNSLSGEQTLIGTIQKASKAPPPGGAGPNYGITLSTPVPPLAGGTAVIAEFNVTLKKVYHYKGKKLSVFTSKCGSDKKLYYQARFTDNKGQVAVGVSVQKCTQKK